MHQNGFAQSIHDRYLVVRQDDIFVTILLVYVDDILIIGNHKASVDLLKKNLQVAIKIKDMGI